MRDQSYSSTLGATWHLGENGGQTKKMKMNSHYSTELCSVVYELSPGGRRLSYLEPNILVTYASITEP